MNPSNCTLVGNPQPKKRKSKTCWKVGSVAPWSEIRSQKRENQKLAEKLDPSHRTWCGPPLSRVVCLRANKLILQKSAFNTNTITIKLFPMKIIYLNFTLTLFVVFCRLQCQKVSVFGLLYELKFTSQKFTPLFYFKEKNLPQSLMWWKKIQVPSWFSKKSSRTCGMNPSKKLWIFSRSKN